MLNCKKVKTDKSSINATLKVEDTVTIKNQPTTFDSIPFWKEAKFGSNYILKDFPDNWSYPSIISDDYDESLKNIFSEYLEKIANSYNLINMKKDVLPIKIPNKEITIKDEDFEVLNYPITIETDNLSQLYKLNDRFFAGIFQQESDKPINTISKRIALIVFDLQSNIIDKINILVEGNGDQHAFMKYFYLNNGILKTRFFYVYDRESSASSIKKYTITNDGKIVKYK